MWTEKSLSWVMHQLPHKTLSKLGCDCPFIWNAMHRGEWFDVIPTPCNLVSTRYFHDCVMRVFWGCYIELLSSHHILFTVFIICTVQTKVDILSVYNKSTRFRLLFLVISHLIYDVRISGCNSLFLRLLTLSFSTKTPLCL